MDEQPLRLPSAVEGHGAYDLRGVERFLLDACEERGRVMEEIAATRRRIAEIDAELTRTSETELRLARMVIEAQRVVRHERRANDRAVAAIRADGEAQAERLLVVARQQVSAMRASLVSMDRSAPVAAQSGAPYGAQSGAQSGAQEVR